MCFSSFNQANFGYCWGECLCKLLIVTLFCEGVTTYQVSFRNGSDTQAFMSNDTRSLLSSLAPNTEYAVTVKGTDSDGKSFSGTKLFTTGELLLFSGCVSQLLWMSKLTQHNTIALKKST